MTIVTDLFRLSEILGRGVGGIAPIIIRTPGKKRLAIEEISVINLNVKRLVTFFVPHLEK
jgi:hypothetical protein